MLDEILMNLEKKKVVIITYYWPPAGGPGVQRWLKFVKYLPDFEIIPIVYVPQNPTYPILDSELISEVSKETIVIKKSIFEPYQLASVFSKKKTKKISSGIIPNPQKQTLLDKILLWIRGNIFIPDARIFWVKPSVKFLKQYIQENSIDVIITSGPPHSLHGIGLELKNKLNVKWLADFRDPWTTIGYHKDLKLSNYAKRKHKKIEKKILNAADSIIVTSKTTKTEFQELTNKPIEVITNGFDFEKIEKQGMDSKFSLAHIGSFLSERNPSMLWESLSEIVKEVPEFQFHLELKLIGIISQEVMDTIEKNGLQKYVNMMGYLSHKEALVHQRTAQVLLLIEVDSENTKSIIPGKLFEYMVSERPIIAIGPKGSDFAEIIQKTNTGIFVDYTQKEKLKQAIVVCFQEFLQGSLQSHPIGLQHYSRKNLTQKLAELLKNI